MPEFAEFDVAAKRAPLGAGELVIRAAFEADVDALADIAHAREGGEREAHRTGLAGEVERNATGEALLLSALVAGRVAAFARCGFVTPPADAPANCIPAGWYLTGAVVSPPYRRLGLATALTHARLRWLFERTERIYYFVNSRNAASIAQHDSLGFREVARDIWTSTRGFVGGIGLLFALERGQYQRA